MLTVTIPPVEHYDEESEDFILVGKPVDLHLEHSLIALSKWESKWEKPFLSKYVEKTAEETIDYIRCMTINKNVDDEVYRRIPDSIIIEINEYMDKDMTATTFGPSPKGVGRGKVDTAEIIYYMMFSAGIDISCEKWHLNRLLTLIRVFAEKNNPKKRSAAEIGKSNRELARERRKKYNTKG